MEPKQSRTALNVPSLIMVEVGLILVFALTFFRVEQREAEKNGTKIDAGVYRDLTEGAKKIADLLGMGTSSGTPRENLEDAAKEIAADLDALRNTDGNNLPYTWSRLVRDAGQTQRMKQELTSTREQLALTHDQLATARDQLVTVAKERSMLEAQLSKLEDKGRGNRPESCLKWKGKGLTLYRVFHVENGYLVQRYPHKEPEIMDFIDQWGRDHKAPFPIKDLGLHPFNSTAAFLDTFDLLNVWAQRASGLKCMFFAQSVQVSVNHYAEQHQAVGAAFYYAPPITDPREGRRLLDAVR